MKKFLLVLACLTPAFDLSINKANAQQLQPAVSQSGEQNSQSAAGDLTDADSLSPGLKCGESSEPVFLSINSKDYVYLFKKNGDLLVINKHQLKYCYDVGKQNKAKKNSKLDVISATLDPLGRLFAVALPREVLIYSIRDDGANIKLLASLNDIESRIQSMEFHPNGDSLLIGASDGQIYQWYFQDEMNDRKGIYQSILSAKNRVLERYYGHSAVVSSIAFHPYAKSFFSADWNGVLSVWKPYREDSGKGEYDKNPSARGYYTDTTNRVVADRGGASEEIVVLKVTLDGEILLVAASDGIIEGWKVRGFKKMFSVTAHKGVIFDLAIVADGNKGQYKVATIGRDGFIKNWKLSPNEGDPDNYNLQPVSEEHAENPRKIVFDSSGELTVVNREGEVLK